MVLSWTTPDRRKLVLSEDLLPQDQAWGYSCSVAGLEGPLRFYVGKGRTIRSAVLDDGGEDVEVTSFSMGDAMVQILARNGEDGSQTLFIWEGPHHELYAAVGGTGVDPEKVADYLADLGISDDLDGLRTAPVGMGSVQLERASTLARDIGSIDVTPSDKAAVPRLRGRRTAAGEVWSWEEGDAKGLMVASSSAITQITQTDRGRKVDGFVEKARIDVVNQ